MTEKPTAPSTVGEIIDRLIESYKRAEGRRDYWLEQSQVAFYGSPYREEALIKLKGWNEVTMILSVILAELGHNTSQPHFETQVLFEKKETA